MDSYADVVGDTAEVARGLGLRTTVGAPIVIDGKLWGALVVASRRAGVLPDDTASRLHNFAELVATAISNAESREALHRLVDEQTALRRVATLVAEGARGDDLFAAVAQQVAAVAGVPAVSIQRYDADGWTTVLGEVNTPIFAVGTRWPLDGQSIAAAVQESGSAVRIDDYTALDGRRAAAIRESSVVSGVGAPIVVGGAVWGVVIAASTTETPLSADTEERLSRFTELLATSISNATMRADLVASRARVVAAADETRRKLERDLHDGIQQWLVALALRVRTLALEGGSNDEISRIADDLGSVIEELREISRGIHPAILSEAGIGPALRALARRSTLPVALDVQLDGRFDESIEAAAYYVVSEALTNAAKHAQASRVDIRARTVGDVIALSIRDDGVGGADPTGGSGLVGLRDRVEALGGTIVVESPQGGGTEIRVRVPVGGQSGG
jgi:signal transduction histidine kinase